jgi:hypothetical protein
MDIASLVKSGRKFADTVNGIGNEGEHLMTWEEVLDTIRENPIATNPDDASIVEIDENGNDVASWTCAELAKEAGIELESI